MEPRAVIDEVKKSGLRGRGGAGFPTGVKWTFIPPNNTKPVYLVCNCDESEPGTFKDRYIVHQDPHQLIEGMVISSYAVGAHLAYIYMREEFPIAAETMLKALQEARERGFLAAISRDPAIIWKSTCTAERSVHCGEKRPCSTPLKGIAPIPASSPLLPGRHRPVRMPHHCQQRGIPLPGETHHGHGRRSLQPGRSQTLPRHAHHRCLRRRAAPRLL
ncbi:MAG: hypothetical protein ACLSUW_04835 [Akkermansia sp.]